MTDPSRNKPITGTASSDVLGKPTASASIGTVTYTCSGDTAVLAAMALARRLISEGYDPVASLTVGAVTLARLDQAI